MRILADSTDETRDSAGGAKPADDLGNIPIGNSLRVDPVAYAWKACNPGKPFPKSLGRLTDGASLPQAGRQVSNPNARLRRNSVKEKLWTPEEIRELNRLAREVTVEAAAAALRRTFASVKMKAVKAGISFRKGRRSSDSDSGTVVSPGRFVRKTL